MAEGSSIKEFPDISSKLTAPTKRSQFERQRAEAEAKRAREKAETAAVYEDFVKSFDNEGDNKPSPRPDFGGRLGGGRDEGPGYGGFGGPSKRHFTAHSSALGKATGPGSLGPAPSSFSKKRPYDADPPTRRDNTHGLFAFENSGQGPMDTATAFQRSDDEDEAHGDSRALDKAAAKPTLHLSSLPPGTSPAAIKAMIPSLLTVEKVKILPTSGSGAGERKSSSAIVTLAKDTPATDIDTAVNSVQNRYLGWGFNLSISRHLSSAAVSAGVPISAGITTTASLPFGARPISHGRDVMSRAPPPGSLRGSFAPPSSYAPGSYNRAPAAQVTVKPPSDLKQLKLIHKTVEALLTYGPEFEALLMSRADVQREEKWSWLWNPRSPGGVWYRWRLWDILNNPQGRSKPGFSRNRNTCQLFDGGAPWVQPETGLKFEYTTQMEEFVSDPEYDSSDDDSENEGNRRRHHEQRQSYGGAPLDPLADPSSNTEEQAYLNPLQKAKLTHLLARLPITNAKLRKGDVARITAFAIEHAGSGADEVVEMIVSNVSHPLSHTTANPDRQNQDESAAATKLDDYPPSVNTPNLEQEAPVNPKDKLCEDTSPSSLISLYLISDILASSSTSGVRHAWRYRSLFESSLKAHHTFSKLGRLEKELKWGRLKAEKWKRSVMTVLGLWEGWCVFPQESQDSFVDTFNKPPMTEKEKAEERNEKAGKEKAEELRVGAGKSKWRAVDEVEEPRMDFSTVLGLVGGSGGDGGGMDIDVDGTPMDEQGVEGDESLDGEEMEDLDGEPMEDEDLDGEPMAEENEDEDEDVGDLDGRAVEEANAQGGDGRAKKGANEPSGGSPSASASPGVVRRRQRPKAEDMFADSDED